MVSEYCFLAWQQVPYDIFLFHSDGLFSRTVGWFVRWIQRRWTFKWYFPERISMCRCRFLMCFWMAILWLDYPPPKTNMTMENPPFEDVFPIGNGDFPMSCWFFRVSFCWVGFPPTPWDLKMLVTVTSRMTIFSVSSPGRFRLSKPWALPLLLGRLSLTTALIIQLKDPWYVTDKQYKRPMGKV